MGQDGSEQPSSARKMSTGSSDTEHVDEGREVFVQSTREPQNIDITNVTVSNQTDVEEMPKSSITGNTVILFISDFHFGDHIAPCMY